MTAHSRIIVVVVLGVCAAIACSLNPQPLPPDNPDGSTTTDGAMTNFGSDSGGAGDGASETGSASPDASSDASDASTDAEDSATDASDDGEDAEID